MQGYIKSHAQLQTIEETCAKFQKKIGIKLYEGELCSTVYILRLKND